MIDTKVDTTIQNLQFALIEKASFNEFNGEQVVKDLRENDDLWHGVIMDRAGYSGKYHDVEPIDLIKLRDIGDEFWNVDTIYIYSNGKNDYKLELLAHKWNADEISWIEGDKASALLGAWPGEKRILRCWWD